MMVEQKNKNNMADIEYPSNMGKALAAWVDCNKEKRGFILIAYEQEDDGVQSVSSAMGDLGIVADCTVSVGIKNQDGPIGIFVRIINNLLALHFLEKFKKKDGGEK